MKKVAILQSNYIPWRGYFDILSNADEFILYDEVQYTKNDWRNRNKIKTAGGSIWLTIPVLSSSSMRISDVQIVNSFWQKKHYKSITESYSKAPFYKQVKPMLEEVYLESDYALLSEANLKCLEYITAFLGISTKITPSSDFAKTAFDRNQRLVELVKHVGGDTYLTGPSALRYLNIEMFRANGITVECIDYTYYSEYPQLHGVFDPGVSIIDTIMMLGRDAKITFLGAFDAI
ncbi:MAG: WbqC family protein [Candidatus Puniceispirillaceae bacterium]